MAVGQAEGEEQCNWMLENIEKVIYLKQLLYPNVMKAIVYAEYHLKYRMYELNQKSNITGSTQELDDPYF